MSEWRTIYQRFGRLEREWFVHEHPDVNRQLFRTAVLSKRSDAEMDRELRSFGVAGPPSENLREARALRAALDFVPRGRSPEDPSEDGYQAALTTMPFGVWTASPSHEQLYRGQRDARWWVVPSLFRQSRENQAASLARVNGLAKEIAVRHTQQAHRRGYDLRYMRICLISSSAKETKPRGEWHGQV